MQLAVSGLAVELSEKFLVSLCGWPVLREAKALQASGAVAEAVYEPPALRGRIVSGGKAFAAGLRIRNAIDIENLCPCRDSRVRGIICAHSVAVGLAVLNPRVPTVHQSPPPGKMPGRQAAETTSERPSILLKLEGSLRHVEADLGFRYAREGVSNGSAEAEAIAQLLAAGFEPSGAKAVLRGEDAILRFFATELPRWKQEWTVETGERFEHVTRDLVQIEPAFALREREDGWLDFHVHFTAGAEALLSLADMQRLLASGKPRLSLSGGRVALPDAGVVGELEEVLRDCDPRQERGRFLVPPAQRAYVEATLAALAGDPAPSPQLAPEERLGPMRRLLRPYQSEGARWLLGRALDGSAGLLADEMGLGKTVQTLAMFEALEGPHLVVCPSSLVWNWAREAATFSPQKSVLALHGAGRFAEFDRMAGADIVVTSYALLRRDAERYTGTEFRTVVLDEAQHIKNPGSQNAKAATALRARARFVLTGTPLENSVRDLWSLFGFLLPGYLGSQRDFAERYEKPLAAGARGEVWTRLVRRVGPWMLRRRKAEVLSELPDKIEQIVEVELTVDQKRAYTGLQIAARQGIEALRERGGTARMQVLTALLRLRQACCDVRLLGAESPAPSAKLEALVELLGEAVDGGHRVLVFSQFTSMLDLIAEALTEAGFRHCRLDGSTRDRAAEVDRFESDLSIPVFLISLKAGGTGLNLTSADTVIHFDPWWNPAAEAQATDRVHRIGQKNVVTSIKLIARDTVESRVLAMQRTKRELLGGLFENESAAPALTAEDLLEVVG